MFLLLVALRNPVVFAQCVVYLLWCTVDQRPFNRYISDRLIVLNEAIANGLQLDEPRGLSSGYTAAHVLARIKLYEASRGFALQGNRGRYIWRKLFGPVTPGTTELYGLAAVANTTTGSMSLRRLGVSASQRHIESMLVFPRYLRCVFALLFYALGGGTRGNESRIVLSLVALLLSLILVLT